MADEIEIKNAVIVEISSNPPNLDGIISLFITLDFGNSLRGFVSYPIRGSLGFTRNENPSTFPNILSIVFWRLPILLT